jgi:hypothetical protein
MMTARGPFWRRPRILGNPVLRWLFLPLGLLMNFGAAIFKNGIKRIVNNHSDFASPGARTTIRLRVHRKLAESGEK